MGEEKCRGCNLGTALCGCTASAVVVRGESESHYSDISEGVEEEEEEVREEETPSTAEKVEKEDSKDQSVTEKVIGAIIIGSSPEEFVPEWVQSEGGKIGWSVESGSDKGPGTRATHVSTPEDLVPAGGSEGSDSAGGAGGVGVGRGRAQEGKSSDEGTHGKQMDGGGELMGQETPIADSGEEMDTSAETIARLKRKKSGVERLKAKK